jgi:hypothetical protein
MITHVTAAEHQGLVSSGKTGPSRLGCEKPDGTIVDVVAKFSAGCQEYVLSLARELVAALLAGQLGLPIPEPYLVRIPAGWPDVVADVTQRAKIKGSSPVAFGSKLITGGYAVWNTETLVDEAMLQVAASIFVFDAIIQNNDRRSDNPNCLVKGNEIRIFDHELAFTHGIIIGWRPPWVLGGLGHLMTPGRHIFRQRLVKRAIDYGPIRASWAGLQDAQIDEYGAAIPTEWAAASNAVTQALQLIRDARDHIDGCLAEIERVLT